MSLGPDDFLGSSAKTIVEISSSVTGERVWNSAAVTVFWMGLVLAEERGLHE